jgi:hypothetical protein
LTIAGDKGKGILGEADLNLSDYSETEFKIFKLPLKKCLDEDAYIEVGLRATQSKEKLNRSSRLETEAVNKDQMIALM